MKVLIRRVTLAGLALLFAGAWGIVPQAKGASVEELEVKINKMQQEYAQQMTAMKAQMDAMKVAMEGRVQSLMPSTVGLEGKSLPEIADAFEKKDISQKFGGVYTKPFLQRFGRNTYVGGYMDFDWNATEKVNPRFQQKRLIPFIYSDVSERIKFATEIEFENAGPQNNAADGEVKLEFATLDYLIHEKINFRGGLLLSPLGKYNLIHDTPLQESFTRPLVDRFIIPTTLSEPGAGFYGSFYPSELAKLDYEIYITQGFRGLDVNGTNRITTTNGLRNARASDKTDINNRPAMVGRLAYSPFLGLEMAYSTHVGTYDQLRDNRLWINAVDFTWQKGPFEVLGEGAFAKIGRNDFAQRRGVPDDMWGYYLQTNYHFMPGWLKKSAPSFFKDDSTFTLFGRWDHIDMDGNTQQKIMPGITFRPTPDTVFGLNYQANIDNGAHDARPDDTILEAWFATYF